MFGIRSRLNSSGANRMISSTIRNIQVGSVIGRLSSLQFILRIYEKISFGGAILASCAFLLLFFHLLPFSIFLVYSSSFSPSLRSIPFYSTPSEGVTFTGVFPTPLEGVEDGPECAICPRSSAGPISRRSVPFTPSEGVTFTSVFLTPLEGVVDGPECVMCDAMEERECAVCRFTACRCLSVRMRDLP